MSAAPINVLVVDDSQVMRMLLVHLLEQDPAVRVAGAVDGGPAALAFVANCLPDVVLMDIHMDGMDGFEVTRRIMEATPVPIVMCSAVTDPRAVATVFRAYEAGAVAVAEKPVAYDHPEFARLSSELLQTVKLMAEVRVVRRWPRRPVPAAKPPKTRPPGRIEAVGIGASTGGPPALQTLLGGLPKDFPAPLLVVQHISAGFLPGLAEWLSQTTALQVQIAAHGVEARPGHVYLAPDDFHLAIDAQGCLRLSRHAAESGLRPAVDHLFRSLAEHCGASAVGVLLTGMGRDGALELRTMRERGAITIAQDHATSVVYGMPGEAVALQAASQVLPIERIADALCRIAAASNPVSQDHSREATP
ncbi:MAG: chemotaxis-specific protein-glutamate methyltransferase CheB [Proteobacteria bacterium]|nr:chemotaxis-specific protein-glutamate methyltransferase CheB [Pseudomonadota bacterium]